MEQEIRYCTTSDGVRIAYGTYGNDSLPALVHMCANPWQEAIWAAPWGRACFEAFGRAQRLITLDPRGQGLSQRDVAPITLDSWVADVLTVVDHLEVERFSLFAPFPSDAVGLTLAARYAERVTHLALWSPRASAPGSPELGVSALANWSMYTRAAATSFFPSGPPEAQRWFSNSMRSGMSPAILAQFAAWAYDLEPLFPQLTMPVLVLHRKQGQIGTSTARVASLIPNARLVMLDGDVGLPYWEHEQFIHLLEEFLGVATSQLAASPHGMTAILFADIVDSTALTERMGDAAFRTSARALDASLRVIIAEAGGTTIDAKTLGDGVLATFPAASQAIDAALRCAAAGDEQGLPLHLGLHAGDVIREANNIFGGAVNIASRISGLSAPGEVLVSDIVRGLARTSAGVTFEDRGAHALKGVAEPQRVYAVRANS